MSRPPLDRQDLGPLTKYPLGVLLNHEQRPRTPPRRHRRAPRSSASEPHSRPLGRRRLSTPARSTPRFSRWARVPGLAIVQARQLSRATMPNIRQNLVFGSHGSVVGRRHHQRLEAARQASVRPAGATTVTVCGCHAVTGGRAVTCSGRRPRTPSACAGRPPGPTVHNMSALCGAPAGMQRSTRTPRQGITPSSRRPSAALPPISEVWPSVAVRAAPVGMRPARRQVTSRTIFWSGRNRSPSGSPVTCRPSTVTEIGLSA